jgi:hypothetical protein
VCGLHIGKSSAPRNPLPSDFPLVGDLDLGEGASEKRAAAVAEQASLHRRAVVDRRRRQS